VVQIPPDQGPRPLYKNEIQNLQGLVKYELGIRNLQLHNLRLFDIERNGPSVVGRLANNTMSISTDKNYFICRELQGLRKAYPWRFNQ